jgi:competence protein ComEC
VIGHPSWWLIAGYYGLIIATLMRRRLHLGHGQLLACWLLSVNLWVWSSAITRMSQAKWLEVTTLDVGHGDAMVIRTPGRQTLLVDTGTQEAGEYAVVPFLRYHGVGAADALFLTHFDEDHLGGALPLLQSTRVRRVFTNGAQPTTPTGHQVLAMARAKRIPVEPLSAGVRLTGLGGADMMMLHPPESRVPGARPESNDNSIVAKLTRGRISWLLCADIEEAGLPWLLAWRETLRSTILKVPHHGSALGREGKRFAEQVRPSIALISVGRRHGLPASSTLDEWKSVGSQIMSTREAGAVTIRTDGVRLLVTNYRKQASP